MLPVECFEADWDLALLETDYWFGVEVDGFSWEIVDIR